MATVLGTSIASNYDDSTNIDNSKAYGGVQNASTDQLGSNVTLSDSAGATITLADPGAIAAGREIADRSIDAGAASLSAINATAADIARRSLDLATASQQGQGGTLINGLVWIVGLTAGAAALYAIFGRKKKLKVKP